MKPNDIRILAVDDDPLMLETIRDLFKSFQFLVDTAESGNAAWKLYDRQNYELVVTDVRMPDGDGIELAKKIKQKSEGKTGVLFISGFADSLVEDIHHIGVEGIFSKPFDSSAVKKAIEACLLSPVAKWSHFHKNVNAPTIEKSGNNVVDLESQRSVLFGRGGFFFSDNNLMAKKDSAILFKIMINPPSPIFFTGMGIVRWVQRDSKENSPAGFGLEIISMPTDQAKIYNAMFGHLIEFIPSPRLTNESKARSLL